MKPVRLFLFTLLFFIFLRAHSQRTDSLIPYRSGDKWGYADARGNIIIQPEYEIALPFSHGYATVWLNKQAAVINASGEVVIPFAEQTLAWHKGAWIKMIPKDNDTKMGVVDLSNREIIPFMYDVISVADNGLLEITLNDKHGLFSIDGTKVLAPEYDFLHFKTDSLLVASKNNSQALFSSSGRQYTPFKYLVIGDFREGLAKARVEKFGFIDIEGREAIPITFDMAYPFSEGRAAVQVNNKWGMIDRTGRLVIDHQYDALNDMRQGVASAKKNEKWALIDRNGDALTAFEFDDIRREHEGLIAVKKDGKWALMGTNGKLLSRLIYDSIEIPGRSEQQVRDFGIKDRENENDKGYALISINNKWGIIQAGGKEIIRPAYDDIYPFTNGVAPVKSGSKWALFSNSGRQLTTFAYERLEPYIRGIYHLKDYGLVLYMKNGRWGLLNRSGKEITAAAYDLIIPDISSFRVMKNNKVGVIDLQGKLIIPVKYDRIANRRGKYEPEEAWFYTNFWLVQADGRQGYVSTGGKEYFK